MIDSDHSDYQASRASRQINTCQSRCLEEAVRAACLVLVQRLGWLRGKSAATGVFSVQ
jgi:hypothetical protein